MKREFIYTSQFRNAWTKMGLDDDDLRELEEFLLENPQCGEVIEGTGGARKLRIQLEGRGKRGGARVIYVDIYEREHLYMLLAYAKNVQEDMTPEQKKAIRKLIETLKEG